MVFVSFHAFSKKKRKNVFSLVEARGYVGNPQGCPSGCRVTAQQLSTGAAYPQPYLFLHRIAVSLFFLFVENGVALTLIHREDYLVSCKSADCMVRYNYEDSSFYSN